MKEVSAITVVLGKLKKEKDMVVPYSNESQANCDVFRCLLITVNFDLQSFCNFCFIFLTSFHGLHTLKPYYQFLVNSSGFIIVIIPLF